jgi:AcrR family transcriptional regulator
MRIEGNRRDEIVSAALAIVSETGLEGLTMKGIAAQIGVSDAALYRHFKNKSEILNAMVDRFVDGSTRSLARITAAGNSETWPLEEFFFDRCRSFAADRASAAVMFAEDLFKSDARLAARVHGAMRRHRRLLLRSIRMDQRRGRLRPLPPEHVFTIVMGALRLLVLQWQTGGYAFPLLPAAGKLWRSLAILIATEKGEINEKKDHQD